MARLSLPVVLCVIVVSLGQAAADGHHSSTQSYITTGIGLRLDLATPGNGRVSGGSTGGAIHLNDGQDVGRLTFAAPRQAGSVVVQDTTGGPVALAVCAVGGACKLDQDVLVGCGGVYVAGLQARAIHVYILAFDNTCAGAPTTGTVTVFYE